MAIKIPEDAKVLKDSRLTAIAAIALVVKFHVQKLKEDVKAAMKRRGVKFAESDFAVAHLRDGGNATCIDTAKLFKLTTVPGKRKLTVNEFFQCVRASRERVEEFLSPEEIEAVSVQARESDSRLYTELMPNAAVNFDAIEQAVIKAVTLQLSKAA
jgi:hypothetical protein